MLVPPHDAFRASSLQRAPRVNGVSSHAPEVAQLHAVRRQTLRTSGGTAGQRARVAPRSRQPSPRARAEALDDDGSVVEGEGRECPEHAQVRRREQCAGLRAARRRRAVGARERRLQGAPVLARSASRRARGRRALRSRRRRRRPSRTRVPAPDVSPRRERAERDRGDRRECRHGEHEPHTSDTSAVRREYLFRAEIASQRRDGLVGRRAAGGAVGRAHELAERVGHRAGVAVVDRVGGGARDALGAMGRGAERALRDDLAPGRAAPPRRCRGPCCGSTCPRSRVSTRSQMRNATGRFQFLTWRTYEVCIR